MNQPLIKICGIRTPTDAYAASSFGANFIGIIFYKNSKRMVKNIKLAKKISAITKKNYAEPVAIFVDQSATEMEDICKQTDIQVIQLHGNISRNNHRYLPANFQRLYVKSVSRVGNIVNLNDDGLLLCDPQRDYLLFDNENTGCGESFNWKTFKYSGPFRMGLAGGLTADNVSFAMQQFKPALLDISSGVEDQTGQKNIFLIKKFIDVVHSFKKED